MACHPTNGVNALKAYHSSKLKGLEHASIEINALHIYQ